MAKFSTPRGTEDILPEEWPYWNFVFEHMEEVAALFGYRRIQTPNFAETGLFARTSGKGSDLVDHEMYSFQDRGGDNFTLRPEGTAPVMRAYFQHGMDHVAQPVKLYYIERMYRYDRPQRGRYREHHQFGCEAIGSDDPYVDVELIALLHELYRRLGLTNLSLHLNSIGDEKCRPAYIRTLEGYLGERSERLSPRDQDRLQRSPLRVLDSKERQSEPALADAPRSLDHLCDECRAHWQKLLHGLDVLDISYVIDHRLVRGLDYYTRTVFEFMPPGEGAQSTVGAGGRYDGLAEAIGASAVPGVGFGCGVERLISTLKEAGVEAPLQPATEVFVLHHGVGTADAALRLLGDLRSQGMSANTTFGERSLRSQMKQASGSGATFAAIIGETELAERRVTVRNLHTGDQESVEWDQLPRAIRRGQTPGRP